MEKYEKPVVEVMEIEDDVLATAEMPEADVPASSNN